MYVNLGTFPGQPGQHLQRLQVEGLSGLLKEKRSNNGHPMLSILTTNTTRKILDTNKFIRRVLQRGNGYHQ